MACPNCGAASPRNPIAPGYWECRNTITEMLTVMSPMPGRPWMSEPGVRGNSRLCQKRYHESGEGGDVGIDCFCGTSSIATCQECGGRFCGDHSSLVGDRRLCRDDLRQLRAAKIARLEAEVASLKAQNARRMAEEAEWARGFDPMDVQEALAVLITPDNDARRRNSAREALRPLDVRQFTIECIEYGRRNFKITKGSLYGGSPHTIMGRALWKARMYECWWLSGRWGVDRAIGAIEIAVTTDKFWLRRYTIGEDWSRVSYFDMTPGTKAKIIGLLN